MLGWYVFFIICGCGILFFIIAAAVRMSVSEALYDFKNDLIEDLRNLKNEENNLKR